MFRVKYLDKILFMMIVLSNWSNSSIFKSIPGVVLVFDGFELKIVSSVSCSPFRICSVMKLDIRQLVLHFLLSRADIFVELMMDVSSFSCSFSVFFKTFCPLNIFTFFQFIAQFYFSSGKMPHHFCSLFNTMDIWLSFYENC